MQDLIERARGGDQEAFDSITSIVGDRLYAIAVRILHDQHDAEDAVQTALLEAWRDLPSLRDANRFDAWLYRLLIRACYDHAGSRRRFVGSVKAIEMEPAAPDEVAFSVDRDLIQRAFRRLSVEQRAVVVLHHYYGLPLTETAEALGIREGTARSRLHYALRTMRAAIDADNRQPAVDGRVA